MNDRAGAGERMRLIAKTILITTLVSISGCSPNTTSRPTNSDQSQGTSPPASPPSPSSHTDDPATYSFNRNVAFTDVTKDMPAGSVDHIDFDMAAEPNVVVVVTVSAPHEDGLRFTTTFTGANDLEIAKQWQPASGGEPDNQYVALFVLPAAVDAGSTVVH